MIHRLGYLDDFNQPVRGQVMTGGHQLHASRELCEVISLGCFQLILSEEWDDDRQKVVSPIHEIPVQMLLMVVATPIDAQRAYPKEVSQSLERFQTFRALDHRERVAHLVSGFVALSSLASRLANQVD
jgi:hypothetical protein